MERPARQSILRSEGSSASKAEKREGEDDSIQHRLVDGKERIEHRGAGSKRTTNRDAEALRQCRIRRPGAGRPRAADRDPTLRRDLEALIEPVSLGDPESALRWTTKSVRRLAAELRRGGHAVSHQTVAELLHEMDYRLQANRKTLEGTKHPDRDAQFEHLNAAVQLQLSLGQPVISVDTKKKELVGPFRNGGRELRPKGDPEPVLMHDFVIEELGRASPYGVYDVAANEAWVSVGTDHDTAAFAVESIRRWWQTMGNALYPAGRTVSDAAMDTLHLRPDAVHGEWNYSLLPRQRLPLTEPVDS